MAFGYSSFILKNDGMLWATGSNRYGQLGLGDDDNRNIFTKIDIDNIKEVSCGSYHTMLLKNDGTLWSCGDNSKGQLGLGDDTDRNIFTKVDIDNIERISCGHYHTMLLKKDGTLWACGNNTLGQLGLGDNTDKNIFTKIDIEDVKEISAGNSHTMVLRKDGTLWGCGKNVNGGLGLTDTSNKITFTKIDINDVVNVKCGNDYTAVLKKDGTMWACGYNSYGEIGIGTSGGNAIEFLFTKSAIEDIKDIYVGGNNSVFAIKKDGTVWACGYNNTGQLGTGDKVSKSNFVKLNLKDIKQISCGNAHAMMLKEDGTVISSGNNNYGQLGLDDSVTGTERLSFTSVNIDNAKRLWDVRELLHILSLIYHSDKYFKLNDDRLFEEVSIVTEEDFITHGMGNVLDLITPDINGNRPIDLLSDEFEIRTYKNISNSIELDIIEPSFKPVDDLENTFEILTYSDEESAKQINVKALPKENQLVVPTDDIKLYSIENIHKANISISGSDGFVKVVVSCDSGVSWKVFRSGTWSDISLDKSDIDTNGMTVNELSSITKENWDEIFTSGTIRFAYLIRKDLVDSAYEVDKLEILVDMKGTWGDTLKGIDYDIEYINNYLLRVTLNTSGDYKINYADEKSSY